MAKLAMKRIEIIALLDDRKKILDQLQYLGVVDFSDCQDETLVKINTDSHISRFEKSINTVVAAKEILDRFAPPKKNALSFLYGRREITKAEYESLVAQSSEYLQICYDLIEYDRIISENRAAIVKYQTAIDSLKPWLELDIPMQFKGTKNTRCFIGAFPSQKTEEDIFSELLKKNPWLDMVHIEVISAFKEQTCVAVICHSSIAGETFEALRQTGFSLPSSIIEQVPIQTVRQYEKEIERCQSEIEEKTGLIKSHAGIIEKIEFLVDYYNIRKEKYQALSKIGLTQSAFVITGYVPEKYAQKCVDALESQFTVAINLETPEKDEDVPVLLENGDFAAAVESVTAMYALPSSKDVDPNPVMAFFYYLLFGMMLSDAGYGVLMVLGTAFVLKKFKVEESLRKTLKMFFYCGISTVFWGALFGSWFGDIIPIICKEFLNIQPPSLALWFEPVADPIKLLLFSFAIGIVHLFAGLAVSFKISWDEGRKLDAILDTVPTYLLVLGAAPLGAGILISVPGILTAIGKYVALAGVVLIVLTAGRSSKNIFARLGLGLYSLYNTAAGYFSDILSYSRLLALGLATGSIAGVINLMGSMVDNIVLKAIVMTVVFLVGHPLNMAINLLGAYVHTNRLQFVEFFSKFYEGGGRAFSPLKANTKYIRIKEDI